MNKRGTDVKVKKTLVRNTDQKASRPLSRKQTVVLDMGASSNSEATEATERILHSLQNENELGHPSLCSSEALANYLTEVKKSMPPLGSLEHDDKSQLDAKVTKKLNFHFNDRIYKNLIELNANVELKTKRDRRVTNVSSTKRDVEPNIEDFCQDEKEDDLIPNIQIIRPKSKPIKKVETGQLHKLIASFEDL